MRFHSGQLLSRTLLIIGLLLSVDGNAQRYKFLNYSSEDGLAQTQVFSIHQAKNGYLWFGTGDGVSRFDGIKFTNYSTDDSLLDNRVRSIAEDTKGNIWLGSIGGITQFNGTSFTNFKLKSELSRNRINDICEDTEGNLWLATSRGPCKFNGKEFTYYTTEDGLIDTYTRSITLDSKGKLWFGTRSGISIYENNKFSSFQLDTVTYPSVTDIMEDTKGDIWITTYAKGVFRYSNKQFFSYTENEGLVSNWVRKATEDNSGNIWFATERGISKFDGQQFNNFTSENGLIMDNINSILTDSEGNIWLATEGKGVLRFTSEAFLSYVQQDGISSDLIMSITEDSIGNFWFATHEKGICKYDGNSFEVFNSRNELLYDEVWTTIRDRKNRMWFGTSAGINIYDKGQFSSITTVNGLIGDRVTSMCEDSKGNVWVGAREGTSRISEDTIINYSIEQGLTGSYVRSIMEDRNGNMWFGTDRGVFVYNWETFDNYAIEEGLSDSIALVITQDYSGRYWVGTKNGLNYYNGSKFKLLQLEDNYRSDYINFLLEDNNQHLWVGTNNGIFEIDLKDFEEDNQPKIEHYTSTEGIVHLESNLNASYMDSKGNLWFGTGGGLVKFDPNKKKTRNQLVKPYIQLTGIRSFLEEKDWTSDSDSIDSRTGLPVNLELTHNQNHLTFDFVGISHTNPKGVKYTFKLKGFDEDWSPLRPDRFATYTSLPPGEYTFMVKAKNSSGVWSEVASFNFVITPPFWVTWWFYSLCALAVILIAMLIYYWRKNVNRRKRATQQLVYKSKLLALEQQTLNASMNRHFIFNALNSIQYYINRQDKLSANKYLTSFAKLIRKNLDSSSTYNNLVPLSDELERIELYLTLEHMRFRDKFEYEINMDHTIDAESIRVPSMMLQPYIENSIWHGILPMETIGKITVGIHRDGGNIVFSIEDNGIGITTSLENKAATKQDHISKGMDITSSRINMLKKLTDQNIYINGPFELKDVDNKSLGTKVEIVLPDNENELFE
jgi:ligand-binding sensor domain-containing protein